ncbi:hypothetical protein MYSE111917_25240 [Mycobacterium senriense]
MSAWLLTHLVLVSRVKFRDVILAYVGPNYRVANTPYVAAVDAS